MKIAAIAYANVRRMLRERSNIFFVFIFPLAIILLVGVQFGGGFKPVVGVHLTDDDPLALAVVAELEADATFDVIRYEDRASLIFAVEHGRVEAGVDVPGDMTGVAASGGQSEFGYLARTDSSGQQAISLIDSPIARVMTAVTAAQFATAKTGAAFDDALAVARDSLAEAPGLGVVRSSVGESLFPSTLGRFDLGASSQLVLFTFLSSMAGSAALILSRQLGISRRMLATPTSARIVVTGEGAGRWAVAMVQGLYIMVVTFVVFRVDWGDPLGALAILVVFAAVGAGAGMLMGALFSNDQQAGGIGIVLSLGLAALGGCMLPLELFSPTLRTIAHVTPHAWALDGFTELVWHGGGLVDILPELGVLAAYAAVLLLLAAWRLRVVLTRT